LLLLANLQQLDFQKQRLCSAILKHHLSDRRIVRIPDASVAAEQRPSHNSCQRTQPLHVMTAY
jgi:hypothetical protein